MKAAVYSVVEAHSAHYLYLGLLVDVVLEVVVFSEHRLGNDVIKLDGDRWKQRCFGGLCNPRQLGGLLVILVKKVNTVNGRESGHKFVKQSQTNVNYSD